jgi:2-polyprenyl-3-methyl-5-hydroxy-6-metoxy-1,4-benzoquinol methylase
MNNEFPLHQAHNQILFSEYNQLGPFAMGPYSSYTYRHDPRHLLFTLARYKFCAKMLEGRQSILEVGCGDAVGASILLQTVRKLHAVDLEPAIIEDNIRRNTLGASVTFQALDLTTSSPSGRFDGIISLDVIEHIPAELEAAFIENIVRTLSCDACCIIGTPNITSQQYASENSTQGHINLKDHHSLKQLLLPFFGQVFLFSMNDEVIHTGYYPMAHFIFALAVSPKQSLNASQT